MKKFRRLINGFMKDHKFITWILLVTNPILMTLYTIYTISEFIRGWKIGQDFGKDIRSGMPYDEALSKMYAEANNLD